MSGQQSEGNKNQVDVEAESIYKDVQKSLMQALESANNMPISEHLLYSSYQSYDDTMTEQRRMLDEVMSKLSQTGKQHSSTYDGSLTTSSDPSLHRTEYSAVEDLTDKYDHVHDFSELMFDRIGQNLDIADGLTSRDAELIQATMRAAEQNKLSIIGQPIGVHSTNLESSSSSSSQPVTESTVNATFTTRKSTNFHNQNQYHYVKHEPATETSKEQLSSPQIKSQSGGYLGKQHFSSPNQRFALMESKNIARPQENFKSSVDNSYRPFEPQIRVKPNAIVPLKLYMERDEHGNEYYTHPYEQEIQKFVIKTDYMVKSKPIEPPNLASTPIVLVENVQQLEEMCKHIESQKEFAVDVEHHSYRSFQGITCLLQISSRTQDFVIDAIKLWSELYRLNTSFTNPDIVKVFHGADCDILWLQRDFGVYVVNLFDTSRAAKIMKFAHLSLAFLMKHYCNVEPNKSFQLADWRKRPLPLPMLQYAREDTHYLLYIYDRMRNDLLTRGGNDKKIGLELLKNVFERGREICLRRYEKPPFSDTSHLSILRKSRSTFNARQMFAFKELYAWRDAISRELDESVGYVLPNNLMIRIAEYLPREPQGITALCYPIPPTVKKYLSDIHTIILKAIDVPLDETAKVMSGNSLYIDPSLRSIDLDSIGHGQDIAHSAGMQETSVPNLLDKMYQLNCSSEEGHSISDNSSSRINLQNKQNRSLEPTSRLYNFFDTSKLYL